MGEVTPEDLASAFAAPASKDNEESAVESDKISDSASVPTTKDNEESKVEPDKTSDSASTKASNNNEKNKAENDKTSDSAPAKKPAWKKWLWAPVAIAIIVLATVLIKAPWQPNDAAAKILSVTPTDIDQNIIKNTTKFIVKTENGSVEKVKKALYLEPAIDYEINELAAGSEYEIVPATTLADNLVLNIDSTNGDAISYKWAFQTKKDLSVSKIYPANGANYVSENSVIEFGFSYPEIDGVEKHFSISPSIDGTLEKVDRVWRFTPSSPLASNSTYEITITAGLSYGEETMTEDFHSSFSTYAHSTSSSNDKSNSISLDGVSTFTTSDFPVITFSYDNREQFDSSSHITVEQIATADEFISYLKGESAPSTTVLRDFPFEKVEKNEYGTRSTVMSETLPEGYYIFKFKSAEGTTLYTANVQINNLAAYAFESERDLLVWVAENGALASGVTINFRGQDYTTGENGVLKIENISNYSTDLDYLKIGSDHALPLVTAIINYKNDLYPRGFIYTDRPLYKSTDTIQVWGYIPLAFFKDEPNRSSFYVVFDTIKKQVEIDSDGFFKTELKLENYKDRVSPIFLQYKDTNLASKNVEVADYTLENYVYTIKADKNYVLSGENYNFTVEVMHVTGFPAINKDVVVTFDNHDYYGVTDGQGRVNFSIPTPHTLASESNSSSDDLKWLEVKSGGVDYGKYSTVTGVYIFRNTLLLSSNSNNNAENTVGFSAKTLDLSRNVKTTYGFNELIDGDYEGSATAKFYKVKYTRTQNGYYYNNYTKETTPRYNINSSTSLISTENIQFTNGQTSVAYPADYDDATTDTYYSYYVKIELFDQNGRPAYSYDVTYYSNYFVGETQYHYYSNTLEAWDYSPPVKDYAYHLYRFGLKDRDYTGTEYVKEYSIGDHLALGLYDYSGANIENNGSILAIAYQESIIKTEVFSEDTYSLEFSSELYPGATISGAYFKDGKFYRIMPAYRDYDTDDSELTIAITTDKTSYQPGDTVKAHVTATRKDGSHASGRVNLSVVNEAVFGAMEDSSDVLSSIYTNKIFKSYSWSSFRDYELEGGGGRGSTGGGRADFGDTIYFGEKTLSNGEVDFEFKLNDSITSFRLTALVVENSNVINAGTGVANISSYLPLSISTTMPKKTKNTDDFVLNATSVVSSGSQIDYSFSLYSSDAEEPFSTKTVSAAPGETVMANFGKLEVGSYSATISAHDNAGNEDKMSYNFDIIESAQEVSLKKTVNLNDNLEITPTKNPITVEIYDEDTYWYLDYIEKIANNRTERLDTQIAYYKTQTYKNKYYHEDTVVHAPDFSGYVSTDGLLRPLYNASSDRILTALSQYFADDYFELKASSVSVDLSDDASTAIEKLMILAAFREPVLLDLKAATTLQLSDDDKLNLALAFMMIGDYDSAKTLYRQINTETVRTDLLATLATAVNKTEASSLIKKAGGNASSDYFVFAVLGYFENNELDLTTKRSVNVSVNNQNEHFEILPLNVETRVYYSTDLASLKFSSASQGLMANYYYQGRISELGEGFSTDIVASLPEGKVVGRTTNLVLDISGLIGEERNGELNIALPPSLKISSTFTGIDGLYLVRNNNEYVKLSLTSSFKGDTITIPLYVAASGNYELEPIVFIHSDRYHLSDSIFFNI